jgi:hypothetical protein
LRGISDVEAGNGRPRLLRIRNGCLSVDIHQLFFRPLFKQIVPGGFDELSGKAKKR